MMGALGATMQYYSLGEKILASILCDNLTETHQLNGLCFQSCRFLSRSHLHYPAFNPVKMDRVCVCCNDRLLVCQSNSDARKRSCFAWKMVSIKGGPMPHLRREQVRLNLSLANNSVWFCHCAVTVQLVHLTIFSWCSRALDITTAHVVLEAELKVHATTSSLNFKFLQALSCSRF